MAKNAMRTRSWRLLIAALLIGIGTLPLLFNLDHWFREDDYLWLYAFHHPSLWNVAEFLRRGPLFFWRPVQAWLSCAAWKYAGLEPRSTNLLLVLVWAGVLCLLWQLAARLDRTSSPASHIAVGALIAMAAWVYTPYYWFSLAGEALGTLVVLGALLIWLRRDHPSTAVILSVPLALCAAILAKETLGVALAIFLCSPFLLRRPRLRPAHLVPWILPLTVLAVVAVMDFHPPTNASVIRDYRPAAPGSWVSHFLALLTTMFAPFAAGADLWPTPLHRLSLLIVEKCPWFGMAVIAGAVVIRHDRPVWFSLIWVFAGLLPFIASRTLYPRYLHFSAVGAAVMLGLVGSALYTRSPAGLRLFLAAGGIALLLLGAATFYLVLVRQTALQDYGRTLQRQLLRLPLEDQPSIVVVHGLPPAACNRGLGLQELARLATGRNDIWVFLEDELALPQVRRFMDRPGIRRFDIHISGSNAGIPAHGVPAASPPPDLSFNPSDHSATAPKSTTGHHAP